MMNESESEGRSGPFVGLDAVRQRLATTMASAFGQDPNAGLDIGEFSGSTVGTDGRGGSLARAVIGGADAMMGTGFEERTSQAARQGLERREIAKSRIER